jgi:hypothetical protein
MSGFRTMHGDLQMEVRPIAPHTEQDVRDLLASGTGAVEIWPNRLIYPSRDCDEAVADFDLVS